MIETIQGDILKAEAEALVNTVNCVGVMGRGIALQFKKAFPENFKEYKTVCDRKELKPGKLFIYSTNRFYNPKYIINFPTKQHWKGKSRMEYIESGLKTLIDEISKRKICSIAIPPLGSGLGGLKWSDVRLKIEEAFEKFPDVHVLLYESTGAPPADKMVHTDKKPGLTFGRAALLVLMRSYLAAVMDPFVTLLEIHKLMYFMQEAGEDLKLDFKKGTYGPYARNLRHVLSLMEGHYISGYGDAEDDPKRHISLLPDSISQAEAFLDDYSSTKENLQKVVDLISGFETPFGMELLSTIHWIAKNEDANTSEGAAHKTYQWNSRKKMFKEKHINLAWNILNTKGWI